MNRIRSMKPVGTILQVGKNKIPLNNSCALVLGEKARRKNINFISKRTCIPALEQKDGSMKVLTGMLADKLDKKLKAGEPYEQAFEHVYRTAKNVRYIN